MRYVLSDIVEQISERENNPSASGYQRFVGLEHYESGRVEIKKFGDTSKLDSAMKVFHSGDILVARRNVYLRRAGVVLFDGLTSGDSIVLRAKNRLVERILPFILNTDDFWDYADQHSDGTMSKRLSPKMLLQYSFEIRDDVDMQQLADTLWATHTLENAYEDLMVQTDELVKSQFVEMFGDKDYPMVCLSDVADISSGLTKNASRPNFPVKMPYLRVANVFFNRLDLSDVQEIGLQEKEVEKTLLMKDDLLFVEGNGSPEQIGRVALWDGSIAPISHQNHIIKARFSSPLMIPGFAMYYFMLPAGREQILESAVSTSGLYTLSVRKISNFKLPMPPKDEQESFMTIVAQADKSKAALKNSIDALKNTRKSIIADAVDIERKE